jgi:hypothetical protein
LRREKTQISKIRNEKGEITRNTEIQGIIREYFESPSSNKLKNLEEMDKFLDISDHPKLNLNRSTAHNETEAIIKCLPKKEKSKT